MKITRTLSKGKTLNNESEILLRFVGGRGMVIRARSGIYVDDSDWTDKTATKAAGIKSSKPTEPREVKKRRQELAEKLNKLETAILDAFNSTPIDKIDKAWLDSVVRDFHFPQVKEEEVAEAKPFFEVFDEFVAVEGKNWASDSTRKHFVTLKNHLKQFEEENDVDITFDSIDEKFIDDFVDFLENTREMRNSTIAKTYKQLKWFLRWAVNKEYTTNTKFERYKPSVCKARKSNHENKFIVFLNDEELKKVKEFDFSNNERLDRVRDIFVFCCYSGLRYSDVEHLTKNNIYDDMIHITTIKTNDAIDIDLNDTTRSILAKYKDCEFKGNKALPVISNQKMNDFLKEMAMVCEIDQPLTKIYYAGTKRMEDTRPKYKWMGTHTGRKTFIVRGLSKGIAPNVIMKWTGHSDYQAMLPYIDITKEARAAAMKLFND